MKITTADSYRTFPTIPGALLNTRFPCNPQPRKAGYHCHPILWVNWRLRRLSTLPKELRPLTLASVFRVYTLNMTPFNFNLVCKYWGNAHFPEKIKSTKTTKIILRWGGVYRSFLLTSKAYLVTCTVKNLPAMQETRVRSLGWEDPPEKGMATHFSILVWRIPWTEEPGRLQSMGLQRVSHNWATLTTTTNSEGANNSLP